jgi:hypothetical protein
MTMMERVDVPVFVKRHPVAPATEDLVAQNMSSQTMVLHENGMDHR